MGLETRYFVTFEYNSSFSFKDKFLNSWIRTSLSMIEFLVSIL